MRPYVIQVITEQLQTLLLKKKKKLNHQDWSIFVSFFDT